MAYYGSVNIVQYILTSTLLLAMISNAQEARPKSAKSATVTQTRNEQSGLPKVTYAKGDFQQTRIHQDLNGDGWCAIFQRDASTLNRKIDRDSDGITDYEEMVLMQDPDSANLFPRRLTQPELKAQSQRGAIRKAASEQRERLKYSRIMQQGMQNTLKASELRVIERSSKAERKAGTLELAEILKNQPRNPSMGIPRPDSHSARVTQGDTLWPIDPLFPFSGSTPFEKVTGASPFPLPAPQIPMIGIWDQGRVKANPINGEPNSNGLADRIFEGEVFDQSSSHTELVARILGAPTPQSVYSPLETDDDIGSGIGLGLDTIKSTGVAKNNLTVGAVYTDHTGLNLDSQDIALSHFSSRGPIDDGRVKPDIMGPSTFEPIMDGDTYFGATSYAAPAVTGVLALLQEFNVDGGGPTLSASSWKALLLNTATDGTNLKYLVEESDENSPTRYQVVRRASHLGADADAANLIGPDYFFGWGLVNARAAAELLVKNLRSESGAAHISEYLLEDQSNSTTTADNVVIEIPFEHDGDSTEMRIMICWTDPPFQPISPSALDVGNYNPEVVVADDPSRPKNLVNDLDLWIVDPNGKTHRPWVLNPANVLDGATRVVAAFENPLATLATNSLDNVEQIIIDTPISGTYTIKVSHKGVLKETKLVPNSNQYQQTSGKFQKFSLVISGNLDPQPARPILEFVHRIGWYVTLNVRAFMGVKYQLEASNDLVNWTKRIQNSTQDYPEILVEDQEEFPLTFFHHEYYPPLYYRFRKSGGF